MVVANRDFGIEGLLFMEELDDAVAGLPAEAIDDFRGSMVDG